jgi:hypothetical protein
LKGENEMQNERPPKVDRPSLRETMHKPESSVPEIVAGVVIAGVVVLFAIAYWPSEFRKGTAVSENSSTYRAESPSAPKAPPR